MTSTGRSSRLGDAVGEPRSPGTQQKVSFLFADKRQSVPSLSSKFARGGSPESGNEQERAAVEIQRAVTPASPSLSAAAAPGQSLHPRDFGRQSQFSQLLLASKPSLPNVLNDGPVKWLEEPGAIEDLSPDGARDLYPTLAHKPLMRLHASDSSEVEQKPLLTLGVLLCTTLQASAAGTHNVIVGISDFLHKYPGPTQLWGIRNLSRGDEVELDKEFCDHYLNQAGNDILPVLLIARLTDSMINKLGKLCERLQLDGLIFICGQKEMAHVAKIAEHFTKNSVATRVGGVLQSPSARARIPNWMPMSLGFDSACSALAEVAGNISLSSPYAGQDVYHFIVCGSSTVTLEVAMRIHPVLCLIREDISERKKTLNSIIEEICDVVVKRHHEHDQHTGVILMTDRLYAALPEMEELRAEIHRRKREAPEDVRTLEKLYDALPTHLSNFFSMLPAETCHSLAFQVDLEGNPLLRPQEADKEVGYLVSQRLAKRAADGQRSIPNFMPQAHNLRNIALCPTPTRLDCALGYSLGQAAASAAAANLHGYVASVYSLNKATEEWDVCALPLVALVRELIPDPRRSERLLASEAGEDEDKIAKVWQKVRSRWLYRRSHRQPGPVQFAEGETNTMSYLLRAEYEDIDAVVQEEIQAEDAAEAAFAANKDSPSVSSLCPRTEEMLCPLQRARLLYKPRVPTVMEDTFGLVEVDNKGRVCADLDTVRAAFPSLWRTENLKPVIVQTVTEEANLLELLPERSFMERSTLSFSLGSLFSPLNRNQSLRLMVDGTKSAKSGTSSEGLLHDDFGKISRQASSRFRHSGAGGAGMRVAIMHVGRPTPGLNPVLQGLLDYMSGRGKVLCINGGIQGFIAGSIFDLTDEIMSVYINQGGCDILGNGDADASLELNGGNFDECAEKAKELELDGLIICGGRRAHAWTAELAEYCAELCLPTAVVAVPVTVCSDYPLMEQSLGYDTSCHTLASLVGILATQAASSRKVWYFISIAGDSISHLVAEVAMQTHPHVVVTAESVETNKLGLPQIRDMLCNTIEARSKEEKNYGFVLFNGGLLASVIEMRQLMDEFTQIGTTFPELLEKAVGSVHKNSDFPQVHKYLSPSSRALFISFPPRVKAQICAVAKRNAQEGKMTSSKDFSFIDAEMIFKSLVEIELSRRVVVSPEYKGGFMCVTYSLTHQSDAALPTNFDCDLGYTSGCVAAVLVEGRRSGYLVDITRLKEPIEKWSVGGTPLPSFLSITEDEEAASDEEDEYEPAMRAQLSRPSTLRRPAGYRFVIPPRSRLMYDVRFDRTIPVGTSRTLISPGPVQYSGPCAGTKTLTLTQPSMQRVKQMTQSEQYISELKTKASAACPPEVLTEIRTLLKGGVELLKQL